MPDEPSKGQPTGWTPTSEEDHFMVCPTCGIRFDMRKHENIGRHWHEGPEALPLVEPSVFHERHITKV